MILLALALGFYAGGAFVTAVGVLFATRILGYEIPPPLAVAHRIFRGPPCH